MTPQGDLTAGILETLDLLRAHDVAIFDVSRYSDLTDHMIIATGTSNRHVLSLVDRLLEFAKSRSIAVNGVEGRDTAEWVLVDFGDALVNVMQSHAREFYDLESLWDAHEPTTSLG